MELLKVDTLEAAREKLLAAVGEHWIKSESVPLNKALNCVLAEDVYGKVNIPDFRRSMVDGYAVIAKDTMGAGESLPVFLKVVGDVGMGEAADCMITPGTCAYVPTGGMIPVPALGAVAGVIGSLQAVECLKILLGLPVSFGTMLSYDGIYGDFDPVPVAVRKECICQQI